MQDFDSGPVLAVDLDGTLLRSDMLFESFWSAFSRDWRVPFRAAGVLSKGRAALKRVLSESADVDVATLPYDQAVIDYVKEWRANGGRAMLVTASDAPIAERIADHLGIFDEVHASDGTRNLKGPAKAAFLTETFGPGGYAYMGDAVADFAVWKSAGRIVTVNMPRRLRARVDRLDTEAEHLETIVASVRPYLEAMRPHQWLKNVLIFLPMLTAHQFTGASIVQSLLAFLVFSLIASSVYLLNDLLDLRNDRQHPRKRLRPLAAGSLPISHGGSMVLGLFTAGMLLSLPLGPAFIAVMIVYYITTTVYSLSLKRRSIVDICVLAGLYTLRIVAGAAATGIPLSIWLLAFSIFFFFSLAAIKRQAELLDSLAAKKLKASGRGYTVDDLPIVSMMAVSSGYVSILVMALYIQSPDVTRLYTMPIMLSGICCVLLYWISRVAMMTHRGLMLDDPVIFAVRDRISQVCVLIIFGFSVGGALL